MHDVAKKPKLKKPEPVPFDDFTSIFVPKEHEAQPTNVQQEHLTKIIGEIYSKENIEVKTDINMPQINALTKAIVYADRFNSPMVAQVAQKYMELSISKDRKGRKEFTEISRSMNAPDQPLQPQLNSRLGKLW